MVCSHQIQCCMIGSFEDSNVLKKVLLQGEFLVYHNRKNFADTDK